MRFLGFSSSDYLFGRIGSSRINPFKKIFCTHAAAIVSPRSLESKQGAKEPSMEEAK
jgi:hypothetical protein